MKLKVRKMKLDTIKTMYMYIDYNRANKARLANYAHLSTLKVKAKGKVKIQ